MGAGFNDVDDDPSMGWARYAHSMRVFCMNSGLFFIRPTEAALDLLKTTVYRIDTEHGWDQAIFNEVRFFHLPCRAIQVARIFFAVHATKYMILSSLSLVLTFYWWMSFKFISNDLRFHALLLCIKARPVWAHFALYTIIFWDHANSWEGIILHPKLLLIHGAKDSQEILHFWHASVVQTSDPCKIPSKVFSLNL